MARVWQGRPQPNLAATNPTPTPLPRAPSTPSEAALGEEEGLPGLGRGGSGRGRHAALGPGEIQDILYNYGLFLERTLAFGAPASGL